MQSESTLREYGVLSWRTCKGSTERALAGKPRYEHQQLHCLARLFRSSTVRSPCLFAFTHFTPSRIGTPAMGPLRCEARQAGSIEAGQETAHEIAEDTCFLSIPPSVSFIHQAPWALPLNRPACSWRQLGWIEKGAEARRNEQVPRRAKWRTGMASAWWMGWGDVKPCGFIECTLEPACSEAVDHDASDGTGIFP